jgi:hypothetical protein
MYSQKLSSLGLAVLASIVLVAPSVSSGLRQRPDQECAGTTKTWVADGGAPVPNYPPKPPKRSGSVSSQPTLLADGGAPVPNYPPPPPRRNGSADSQPTLQADGGAPVPNYPPPPPKRNGSTNSQPTLLADGGSPVPSSASFRVV